jgi:two-component system C4-dicarboxylate transport sensor histidine kinase DctB
MSGPRSTDPASDIADPAIAERIRALQTDNQRLRDLLVAAGRLAEFGRFAAKQNHELRQPLFAIKGLAQLILEREKVRTEEVRDFARHIVEQSDRLTRLVGDLRHASMPAAQSVGGAVDVSPVLLRVASLLDWRFRKVLINLLSNALDAVEGSPTPVIQVRVDLGGPGQVRVAVADNGHGIPHAVRERLFDTFFSTKGEEAGTGLGLAVSREIARGGGGELELLEAPGTWVDPVVTVFRLTLPAADEQAGR